MSIDQSIKQLRSLLSEINRMFQQIDIEAKVSWQRNAVDTTLTNLNRYSQALDEAINSGSHVSQSQAACKVSGIRKGILDLGLLDHNKDELLICKVDEVDILATSICLQTS